MERLPCYLQHETQKNHFIVAPGQRPSRKLQQANDQSNPGGSHKGASWINALHQFLHAYKCTPHRTTTFTLYYLLFGHKPQTKLPEIGLPAHPNDKLVRHQDSLAKSSMKHHFDQCTHAQKSPLQVGDIVLMRQRKANKLSTPKPTQQPRGMVAE